MRIATSTLLNIDQLFFPIQRVFEFAFSKSGAAATDQVVAIKLKGKGSIIRFVQLSEQLNADKNKLTLVTFAHQRDVCEWLQLKNVLYIRTTNIFQFIADCWSVYRQMQKINPRVIVSLERCSHAVNAFGLLLSRWSNRIVFFEPIQRIVSDKIVIHSASDLSLDKIFKTCIDELAKTAHENNTQKMVIDRNKIIININASDLLSARRYSIQGFATIVRELHQYDSGLQFVLVGASSERDYVDRLIQLLKEIPVSNLAGQLSFKELAEEFSNAALVLTGDSMALHLAAYLRIPVVALWGPTQPDHFGYSNEKNIYSLTLRLPCSPCFVHPASVPAVHCKGRIDCLSQLEAQKVYEVCKEVLMNDSFEREVNFPGETRTALKIESCA